MIGPYSDEALTHSIIGGFYIAYNKLGFGFLESVYASALERELVRKGHRVDRELAISVVYDGEVIARQRLDFLVDERVILELKSTAVLAPHFTRQLYNYLRATELRVGLLLHFGEKPHVHRVYCDHPPKVNS